MEDIKFITNNGRSYQGVDIKCHHCQASFITRKNRPSKYCSKECYHLSSRNRVICECAFCHKEIEKLVKTLSASKSGLCFCNRECKSNAQKIGGIKEIMPSHYGISQSSEAYRREYKRLNDVVQMSCSRCGYNEFECGIDVHHIDKNHSNNSLDNLLALCAPCHRALHAGHWNLK